MATENNNSPGGFLTYTSVMATEDDTNITFEDFPTGITDHKSYGLYTYKCKSKRGRKLYDRSGFK